MLKALDAIINKVLKMVIYASTASPATRPSSRQVLNEVYIVGFGTGLVFDFESPNFDYRVFVRPFYCFRPDHNCNRIPESTLCNMLINPQDKNNSLLEVGTHDEA